MLLLSALIHSTTLFTPAPAPSELDIRRVPADSTWLVHLDLQALRRTDLWSIFLQETGEGGKIEIEGGDLERLRDFEETYGFRPFQDIDAVTVFGNAEMAEEGVILVETGRNLDRALAQLQQRPEYRSLRRNGVELHGWEEHGRLETAFYLHEEGDRRLVVVSEADELLDGAIDVLQGEAKSLAQTTDRRLFPSWNPGAFLVVDATGVLEELSDFDPASAVAEMARGVRVEVAEARGELSFTVHVVANTGVTAQNIYSVLNGARALAALAGTQEDVPQFALDLLDSLEMNVNGDDVSVQFRYNTRDLVRDIQELDESGY